MLIEIKNRYTKNVIISGKYGSLGECLTKNRGSDLSYSNLSYSNLSHSNLSHSDLRGSNLSYSDLSYSNLSYSNLSHSDLGYSDLRGSDLSYSNLSHSDLGYSDLGYSDLRGSDLSHSDLGYSDLRNSDLRGSNLRGSDLRGSDLRFSYLPSPTMLLLCHWNTVSDNLCTELMRYDAENHPRPELFEDWANGDICPYGRGFSRCAIFHEKKELYIAGTAKTARELVLLLFREKNIKFSEGI